MVRRDILALIPVLGEEHLVSHHWECCYIGLSNWPLSTEGKERPAKEADHSRLVCGRFKKQGNLLTRLVLGHYKMSRSLHPPTRILKVYIEALMGFSLICHPDYLKNTLLFQDCVLKNGSHGGQSVCSEDRGESEEPPIAGLRLSDQSVVTSSQWPLPIVSYWVFCICFLSNCGNIYF